MPETTILSTSSPNAISAAISTLNQSGLIAFPTDTVYGLAVPVNNRIGIDRLFEVKGRDANKAIAVLIGSLDQLPLLTYEFSEMAQKLSSRFWPGALTLVVNSSTNLPSNLSPYPTLGIRMPDMAFTLDLLKQTGPLATTSANLSGGANTLSAEEVYQQLGGKIELILDGGRTPGAVPSSVVDCTQSDLVILRQGAISEKTLREALI